jgi:hypothetical protein
MAGSILRSLLWRSVARGFDSLESKRTSQYPDDRETEQPTPEQTLIEAGFRPRTAALLVGINRWLFAFTIVVSGAALIWIGVHLWPDLDAEAWQQWADDNPAFFAPLDAGSTVGIVPDLHGHMGLLIRKLPQGVEVERHLWFPFDEVPVGLVVAPEAAERWLRLDYDDASFWREWEAIAEGDGVQLYEHLRGGSARNEGYRTFLARLRSAGAE